MGYVNSVNSAGGSPLTSPTVDMLSLFANCLIVAVLGVTATSITGVGVTDSQSNNYFKIYDQRIGTDGYIAIFISPNFPSLSTTMTATATWGGGAGLTIFFVGFSTRSSSPIEAVAATSTAAATSQALSIVYPSMNVCDALAVAVQTGTTTNSNYTAGTNWTNHLPSLYGAIAQTQDAVTGASLQDLFTTDVSVAMADFVVLLAPSGFNGRWSSSKGAAGSLRSTLSR